jgi:hypothetical protein
MARTGVGAITITDIKDGIHPISMVLSNQSHTFSADWQGTISAAEKDAFSCEVFAYIGDTRATYDAAATPANNTYDVTITDPAGWVSNKSVVNNQLVIKLTSVPTGTTNKSGKLDLTIDVKNYLGFTTTIEAVISLAKMIEGADGTVVTLTPSRQTFQYDEHGVTTDGNVEIPVTAMGNVGSLSAFYSLNGNTSWSALSVGAGANQASSIDIDGANGDDKIVITPANFGTADVFTVKVTGSAGGSDITSIIRIQDGSTGPSAILVSIKSSTGGMIFKNNAGATKTLTAQVFDMSDGSEITNVTSYQWKKNDVNVAGATTSTLSVSPSDITDDNSEEYSCHVTVD